MKRSELESRIQILEDVIEENSKLIETLQRNAILGRVGSMYLHETRRLLSTLSMLLTQLFHIGHRTDLPADLISHITQQFEDLRNLTDSFCQFAREQQSITLVPIEDCLQHIVHDLERRFNEEGIVLKLTVHETARRTKVRCFELRLFITNLLLNGIPTIANSKQGEKTVAIEAFSQTRQLSLRVRTSVSIIPKDFFESASLRSLMARENQSGIGVLILKAIAENCGWKILDRSATNDCTHLKITLPYIQSDIYD